MVTFTSLFSGGGGFDLGAIAAGMEHAEGLEYDPQIAEVYRTNIGKVHCIDILEANPMKFERPDWLHASPVCFPENTLILTDKGLTPIQLIKAGDLVVTHKGRFRKVTETKSRSSQLIKVKGQGHDGLLVTPDHPFLSVHKKTIYPPYKERKQGNWCHSILQQPEWVKAQDLKGKHWLSLTSYPEMEIPSIEFQGNERLRGQRFDFSPEFFKVIGLWVGNGWTRYGEGSTNRKNRGEISISCNKKKAEEMRAALRNANIKFHETEKRTAINFVITSRPLCRWLIKHFGKLAKGKKIPTWLLGAPDAIRSGFFSGYIETDGCLIKKDGKIVGYRSTTVSRELAFGIRLLGLTLDYSVSLRLHVPNPTGMIEGRTINQSPIYQMQFIPSERLSFVTGMYRSGCVRKIEPVPEKQTVFCLTVEDDESYIADGLVVHNCKAFSAANANKGEKEWDVQCGHKVAEFIEILQPQYFSLENVRAYRDSRAFQIIVQALNANGYHCNTQVINAADFGVPQSRERLFLVAYRGDFRWGFDPFSAGTEKHRGWYEEIADLVHDLPDSKLADWQIKALPEEIKKTIDHILLLRNSKFTHAVSSVPSPTLTADACRKDYKAILIENTGARSDRPLQTREPEEPCWTIRAMGQDGHYHRATAIENGRVVQLSIQCLARLQSFPDWYQFPERKAIAGTIIGNSVPPLVSEKIIGATL